MREHSHASQQYRGLCGGKFSRASNAIVRTNASPTLSHPCLVSLLFIPSLYSILLIRRIFYLLVDIFTVFAKNSINSYSEMFSEVNLQNLIALLAGE